MCLSWCQTPSRYLARRNNYCDIGSCTALVLERELQFHAVRRDLPILDVDVLLHNASDPNVPQAL